MTATNNDAASSLTFITLLFSYEIPIRSANVLKLLSKAASAVIWTKMRGQVCGLGNVANPAGKAVIVSRQPGQWKLHRAAYILFRYCQ
jgi:hypothetical protein